MIGPAWKWPRRLPREWPPSCRSLLPVSSMGAHVATATRCRVSAGDASHHRQTGTCRIAAAVRPPLSRAFPRDFPPRPAPVASMTSHAMTTLRAAWPRRPSRTPWQRCACAPAPGSRVNSNCGAPCPGEAEPPRPARVDVLPPGRRQSHRSAAPRRRHPNTASTWDARLCCLISSDRCLGRHCGVHSRGCRCMGNAWHLAVTLVLAVAEPSKAVGVVFVAERTLYFLLCVDFCRPRTPLNAGEHVLVIRRDVLRRRRAHRGASTCRLPTRLLLRPRRLGGGLLRASGAARFSARLCRLLPQLSLLAGHDHLLFLCQKFLVLGRSPRDLRSRGGDQNPPFLRLTRFIARCCHIERRRHLWVLPTRASTSGHHRRRSLTATRRSRGCGTRHRYDDAGWHRGFHASPAPSQRAPVLSQWPPVLPKPAQPTSNLRRP